VTYGALVKGLAEILWWAVLHDAEERVPRRCREVAYIEYLLKSIKGWEENKGPRTGRVK